MHKRNRRVVLLSAALLPMLAVASSHREAPFIAGSPRLDGTDLYMFRSYEPGRSGYVTFLANYIPFQDPQGGPNFYDMDENAVYKINVDNDGNGQPNLSFEFRFTNTPQNLTVNVDGTKVPVPVLNIGPVKQLHDLNVLQSYTVKLVRGGNEAGAQSVEHQNGSGPIFHKPADNIGNKSIADYPAYAGQFVYEVTIPGCGAPGKVFVGQRKEGFYIDVGGVFDLVNLNPAGARDVNKNDLTAKNVTSIALEVPISCLTKGNDPVIGAYTTSETVGPNGNVQRSRLGMPLVNEVVIGLKDKDKFNGSKPSEDAQFLTYVTHPTLPILTNVLFGDAAKVPGVPRNDLVTVFLTGIPNLNKPLKVTPSEMLRLNTSTPPTPPAKQSDLGVLGGDLAGFPNGRRPYDDVVDITLRVAEGALCGAAGNCGAQTKDPNNGLPYTDGVRAAGPDEAHVHVSGKINAEDTYLAGFPYLFSPLPGAPQGAKP